MHFLSLLFRAGKVWLDRGADQHAAALAYFMPFALVPLLVISITLVGVIIGQEDVIALLFRWGGAIDPGLPEFMKTSVANFETLTTSYTVPILALFFFSTMVLVSLNSLASSLQHIWLVKSYGLKSFFKKSGRSVLFILVFQVYLVATIIFNNFFISAGEQSGLYIFKILSALVFFIFTTLLIAIGYGLLPQKAPSFKARLYGAAIASVLFLFTRTLVTFHIATSPSPDIYGAAGLIFVLLIWIYMAASIIYYGATFSFVYDKKFSSTLTK